MSGLKQNHPKKYETKLHIFKHKVQFTFSNMEQNSPFHLLSKNLICLILNKIHLVLYEAKFTLSNMKQNLHFHLLSKNLS